jgi:hypothetical protein
VRGVVFIVPRAALMVTSACWSHERLVPLAIPTAHPKELDTHDSGEEL